MCAECWVPNSTEVVDYHYNVLLWTNPGITSTPLLYPLYKLEFEMILMHPT